MCRRRVAPFLFCCLSACGGAPAQPPSLATPVASSVNSASAPRPTPPESDLAAKIDPIFASFADPRANTPGCAVGVYRAGEIVFAKGYGYANLEHGIPITARTTFEIGSMSKQFTATAILLLADDGRLSLDDDVRKFIPELPDYGHRITLRHLLHHTGGLREYDDLLRLSGWDVADVATEREALHFLVLQKGTNFPPGTQWSYSNTGYFVLGQVVKRVSGKTLAEFSKERIFEPLGMHDTSILDDHTLVIPRHATGYSPREGGGFQVNTSALEVTGDGNIQTTIFDLARWDGNFYDPKVGGQQWLDTMRTPGKLDDGTPITMPNLGKPEEGMVLTYGMGLGLGRDASGLPFEGHGGAWVGYRSDGERLPTKRLAVTVLCNRDDSDPIAHTDAVLEALVPESPVEPAPSVPPPPDPERGKPAPDISTFVGTYLDPESLSLRTFIAKDGGLQMGDGVGPEYRPSPTLMERDGPRSFRIPGAPSIWTFEPARGNVVAHFTRAAPGERTMTFARFVPQPFDPEKGAAYVGRYESPEMTHDLEVAISDGKLIAGPWGKRHMAEKLSPLDRDMFDGRWFGLVFGRNTKRAVTSMVTVLNGYRAVHWTKRP
jgi:CubicO group peptidase (beta-lactamase class C family)